MSDATSGPWLRLMSAADADIATGPNASNVPVIVLDRPPVNALDLDTVSRLAVLVGSLDGDPAVLTSQGPHFSAGHDRAEVGRIGEDRYLAQFSDMLAALLHASAPLVTVLQGSAVGTGFLLAACAEVLVVTEDARVVLPEVGLGMLGGAGHASRWLSAPWLRRAVLLGEEVPAAALIAAGAVAATDATNARRTATALAARLSTHRPAPLAAARRVLRGLGPDVAAVHADEMAWTLADRRGPQAGCT